MIRVTQAFARAANQVHAKPIVVLTITNGYGQRIYSDQRLSDTTLSLAGPLYADGTWLADGSAPPDTGELLGWGARVVSWQSIRDGLASGGSGILAGLGQVELPSYSVTMDNGDGYFSSLMAQEGLLGATLALRMGFEGLPAREFIGLFTGQVSRVRNSQTMCVLEAEASGSAPSLDAAVVLPKSEGYANPRSDSETLPWVWGNLQAGGDVPVYNAVCIDTVARVYALAAHPIQAVADGQDLDIYDKDGNLLGAGYAFDEANDYEGLGEIATIAFPADRTATTISFSAADNSINDSANGFGAYANWSVTVSGSAKNNKTMRVLSASAGKLVIDGEVTLEDESAGASITLAWDQASLEPLGVRCRGRVDDAGDLIADPISIARDYLINLAGFDADNLDATAWERARQIMATRGHTAGGVLNSDQSAGEFLTGLLSQFGASWRKNGAGQITVTLDLGPGSFREQDIAGQVYAREMLEAEAVYQRGDLCNQAPAEFAYSWVKSANQLKDDGTSTAGLLSQAKHGAASHAFVWPWIRTAAVANARQAEVVAAFATPRFRITPRVDGARLMNVEAGDYVRFSVPWQLDELGLPCMNQFGRALTVEKDPAGAVSLEIMDTGYYLQPVLLADGSVLADGSASGSRVLEEAA